MADEGALAALVAVARALETAGARFLVGGSFASSLQGIPRSTQDVDLVADLDAVHVRRFVSQLETDFYLDEERIGDAVRKRSSFNVIDLRNGFKVDIYLTSDDPFTRAQFDRRQTVEIHPGLELAFSTAEDVVLQKLRWFRMGGEVSERQWLDALGVLKVQGGRLDRGYLATWSVTLGVEDLLARACEDAGLEPLAPPSTPTG